MPRSELQGVIAGEAVFTDIVEVPGRHQGTWRGQGSSSHGSTESCLNMDSNILRSARMPDEKGVGEPFAVAVHEQFDEGALVTGHGEDIEALSSESGSERSRPTYIAVSRCSTLHGRVP